MANRRGITHVKPNEAQGTAQAPTQSTSSTAAGFQKGLTNMVSASKSAYGVPGFTPSCMQSNGFASWAQKPGG